MSLTYIKRFVFGSVPAHFIDMVSDILWEFIERIGGPEYLEVYFYGSREEKLAFLEGEALELGVIAVGDFVAMHEAWRGWPRIHIDYERCSLLKEEHLRAVIVHEVSHAVLHGSPIYYVVGFSPSDFPGYSSDDIAKILYMASTIVKDLDVYGFLVEMGMHGAIDGYIDFILREQFVGGSCSGVEDVLQLAKTLLPCIFVERCPLIDMVSKDCIDTANRLLNILMNFRVGRTGDLSTDTVSLAKQLIEARPAKHTPNSRSSSST